MPPRVKESTKLSSCKDVQKARVELSESPVELSEMRAFVVVDHRVRDDRSVVNIPIKVINLEDPRGARLDT